MTTIDLRLLQLAPLLFFILLTGCVTPVSPDQIASADYGNVPPIYKEAIQGHMQSVLIDPYSAYYRYIGNPVKGYAYVSGTLKPPVFGHIVMVGINAKNRMGGYVGEKSYIFLFHNEQFWNISEYTKFEVVPYGMVNAQNKIREQDTPLATIQGKEGPFYERQVEGDKILAKASEKLEDESVSAKKQKAILESTYEDITQRGHDIMVGEPEVDVSKGMADLSFPVVIKSDSVTSSKIQALNQSQFGKGLSIKTYKNFEQRLDNLYFNLELLLKGEESVICHAPRNLTQYETDGEFLSVNDKPSAWNIKISVPLQSMKRMTSVRGRFVEGARGSVCGVTKNNK